MYYENQEKEFKIFLFQREIFEDKAQRRRQGAGVVIYVKPHSSSNAVFGNLSKKKVHTRDFRA